MAVHHRVVRMLQGIGLFKRDMGGFEYGSVASVSTECARGDQHRSARAVRKHSTMAGRLRPRSAGAVRRDISSTTQSWPEIPALPPAEAAGRTDWNGRFVLGHGWKPSVAEGDENEAGILEPPLGEAEVLPRNDVPHPAADAPAGAPSASPALLSRTR